MRSVGTTPVTARPRSAPGRQWGATRQLDPACWRAKRPPSTTSPRAISGARLFDRPAEDGENPYNGFPAHSEKYPLLMALVATMRPGRTSYRQSSAKEIGEIADDRRCRCRDRRERKRHKASRFSLPATSRFGSTNFACSPIQDGFRRFPRNFCSLRPAPWLFTLNEWLARSWTSPVIYDPLPPSRQTPGGKWAVTRNQRMVRSFADKKPFFARPDNFFPTIFFFFI